MQGIDVSPTSIKDSLGQLFEGLYGALGDTRPVAADVALAQAVSRTDPACDDVTVAARQLLGNVALAPRQMGVLRLAQSVLSDYLSQPAFHPALANQILSASGPLIAEALPAEGWLLRRNHPVSEMLALVAELAKGWYPELPQAGELSGILTNWVGDASQVPSDRLEVAQQWHAGFQGKRDRLHTRLMESEKGAMQVRHARETTAKTLNQLISGRQLPGFMAEGLDIWVTAFQWVLLNKGEQSPLWQSLVRTVGLLVWSLQPDVAKEENRSRLQKVADELKSTLPSLLEAVMNDSAARTAMLEEIQMAHFLLQQGRELDWQEPPQLEGVSTLQAVNAQISRDILAEIASIHMGDWFQRSDTGERFSLLLREDTQQQMLFVNLRGIKAQSYSFEEFAWQFSTNGLASVMEPLPLREWVEERLSGLAAQYRRCKRSESEKQQALDREKAKQDEARAQARQKALAEAQQLEAVQKREAAEKHAFVAAEREAESARRTAVAVAHGETAEQRRQRARLLVSSLAMGAWLSVHDEQGGQQRLKVAVILPSSGKYVLVDRAGTRQRELARDELTAGIAEGAISILDKGSRFDDILNQVVDGLRQDKARGGMQS